jgi:hypothetical protein
MNLDGKMRRRAPRRSRRSVLLAAGAALAVASCSIPTSRPVMPRTPIEQLLISEAIQNGLDDLALDLPKPEAKIYLDVSGLTDEREYLAQVLRGWLGRQGFDVFSESTSADYRALLIVQSLGTQQSIKFFGMPASRSAWLPIALPELAIYKRNREEGYVRFYFDLFDAKTEQYLRSTREYEGTAVHTKYTYFFGFDCVVSDLEGEVRGAIDLTDSGDR